VVRKKWFQEMAGELGGLELFGLLKFHDMATCPKSSFSGHGLAWEGEGRGEWGV